MKTALYLLTAVAFLGAFDTIYYHEIRAKLPALGKSVRSELQLHAGRDFVYAILFVGLPWFSWKGAFAVALAVLFLIEIILTLWDFVVEDWIRKPLGGVYSGERVMHAVMGIVYGAMLAYAVPALRTWWSQPTQLTVAPPIISDTRRWTMTFMAAGVFLSGIRDLYASAGLPGSAWPWTPVNGKHS
jgi:hypothetical protein